ncbi:hypothetical protein FQA39_LY01075 [Lamprigera yunnana]|nr:hypothetical protein FQA39_LY01075 [Lamprigera yunnana]
MDEIKAMLKYIFQTKNDVTLGILSSEIGGIEAALLNIMDPGEKILIAVSGFWGLQIVDMAKRGQLDAHQINSKIGDVFTLATLETEIIRHKPKMLFIIHGEPSMGIVQPLEGLGDICHRHDCLLAVDAIASLGCTPLFIDKWKVDVVVASSNKAMRGPAGLAYLSLSPKAVEKMFDNKSNPPFYFDLKLIGGVWKCFGSRLIYHYTYCAQHLFAVKEGLSEIVEEGLETIWKTHKLNSERLRNGMENIGFIPFINDSKMSLSSVHLFHLPPKVDLNELINSISEKYDVEFDSEMSPGILPCIKIGIMGYNSRREVVDRILTVLGNTLLYFRKKQNIDR